VIARARAVLAAASTIHFVHDGFSDILYVFLPLWASEFGLSLAQVGVIRTTYTGGMALFQIPAGFLAERWGERRLLVAGTAVTALGFVAAGWAGGFLPLTATGRSVPSSDEAASSGSTFTACGTRSTR